MPRGIKIILVLLYISAFAQLISMVFRPSRVAVIFGWTIQPFISLFFYIIIFIIFISMIIVIHKRVGWKSLLAFFGFYTINYLVNSIVVLATPVSKLAEKLNLSLADNISEQVIFQAKLITSIFGGIIFILLLIAWFYIFRKREYFSYSNQSAYTKTSYR